jgi:hypothetical protein
MAIRAKIFFRAPITLRRSRGASLRLNRIASPATQSSDPLAVGYLPRTAGIPVAPTISEVVMEMKFVLVNGRTPSPLSSCALCCEPIGEGYLRDVTTRLAYCDHQCYVGHYHVAVAALEQRARCDRDWYAFARNDFYSADPESSFV